MKGERHLAPAMQPDTDTADRFLERPLPRQHRRPGHGTPATGTRSTAARQRVLRNGVGRNSMGRNSMGRQSGRRPDVGQ